MPTRDEVQALLERVKAATGPDREIDALLFERLDQEFPSGAMRMHAGFIDSAIFATGAYTSVAAPAYTASLDAIVALIEKELPGWRISIDATDGIAYDVYLIGPKYDDSQPHKQASQTFGGMPTGMALCAAFLSAKLAQMQEGE